MTATVLIVSDSHGDTAALTAILEWIRDTGINCSDAIFLGDGCSDLSPASATAGFGVPWHIVRGNGDYDSSIPPVKVVEIAGHKLFLSHGNRYDVRANCHTIAAIARNSEAEAALFGHTHIPHCGFEDGVFLLNPGSISRPRSNAGCTFAILDCPDSGPLNARFFGLSNRSGKRVIQELTIFG